VACEHDAIARASAWPDQRPGQPLRRVSYQSLVNTSTKSCVDRRSTELRWAIATTAQRGFKGGF
jgi:hypothetical protein